MKDAAPDLAGQFVETLWVKASGADLATIAADDFARLDLARLRPLESAPDLDDELLPRALAAASVAPGGPAASVETLLHAFLPAKFVFHTHADAALILADQPDGEGLVHAALNGAGLGGVVGVVPYARSGLALARRAAELARTRPEFTGLVVLQHGVFTWGETAREAYEGMLAIVAACQKLVVQRGGPGRLVPSRFDLIGEDADEVEGAAALLGPTLRGALATPTHDPDRPCRRCVLAFRSSDAVREQSLRPGAGQLASRGPATPDHALWIKARPLVFERRAGEDPAALAARARDAAEAFGAAYAGEVGAVRPGYYGEPDDFAPRVVLVPGVGIFAAGRGPREARIAADLAERTLLLQAAAESVGRFTPPPLREVLDIEFWSAERAKAPGDDHGGLAGRTALVTGAAGAIGAAVSVALARAGALVFMADRPGPADEERLARAAARVAAEAGEDAGVVRPFDVTDPADVERAFASMARAAGGVDLLVLSHGAALGGDLASLDPQKVAEVFKINTLGSFHLLGAFARQVKLQGTGGDVILISTKNVPEPGAAFGAYSASKAGAHQLARVAALELAPFDVRVNMVAPDAVFGDEEIPSVLWQTVGAERARAKGLDPATLPEQYRQRNLLKARVTPKHVAAAVMFFAERRTPTTGAVLPVDGGLPGAFPR